MKTIKQAGAIVQNKKDEILMVYTITHKWTFPKGSVQSGEELADAALREVREETDIRATIGEYLGAYQRLGYTKENTKTPSVVKEIHFYKGTAITEIINVNDDGTLEACWVPKLEIAKKLSYQEDRDFYNSLKRY
jgi:8-oxo-dGTP diphosphatase